MGNRQHSRCSATCLFSRWIGAFISRQARPSVCWLVSAARYTEQRSLQHLNWHTRNVRASCCSFRYVEHRHSAFAQHATHVLSPHMQQSCKYLLCSMQCNVPPVFKTRAGSSLSKCAKACFTVCSDRNCKEAAGTRVPVLPDACLH